ncbi:MAG TPA: glycosyl hydrolase family 65 protein [Polyangiaceae bacterium]|nr:glycosyl hydrolase family 65 protein [Polyangiaceae bacterium]
MQFGYFDDKAREYVVTRPDTPRPWSNYLGTTEYGAIITNNAGGYSFYRSAANHRFLRLRSNSVPLDQPGRYFYLRDGENGDFWSASWQPVGKPLTEYQSTCRHGTAYTIIDSKYDQIETESTYFVPLGQTFEYWRLKVSNRSQRTRRLSVYTFCEFTGVGHVFNDLTNLQYSLFVNSAQMVDGMLAIASHPYEPFDPKNLDELGRYWMKVSGADVVGFETLRENFLGNYGSYARPEALVKGELTNFETAGENVVGVQQVDLVLAPGETRELIVMLGLGTPASHGLATSAEFGTSARCAAELTKLQESWHALLRSVEVKTPDPEFDHMVNVWNAYNALVTYAWSRAASLIYNGERDGLGYRDTVQDFLGVTPLLKEQMRARLELMLTGQVECGGAMPLVRPFSHRPGHEATPAPEHFRSDDALWLFNAVPAYVAETGEREFYDKVLPYADRGQASVLGHLRRALEFNLERTGRNGLPCGLQADWNDCCNLGYTGESVMVAFQVRYGLGVYAEIAQSLGKPKEAEWALACRKTLDQAIEKTCWDGEWFIWATGNDGTVFGTKNMEEGKVYINTQAWAVISGAATPEQARLALKSMKDYLATPYGLMLSAPPFKKTPKQIMGGVIYNAGIKENAGIFNHPQAWAVMAECLLGNGDQAFEYYRAYMPSAYNTRAEVREIEPYVHSQTTYATCNPNAGKSRVPWLTGTVSWSYFVALQSILGVRPELDGLRIDPCIPKGWPGFEMKRVFRGKTLHISVKNPNGKSRGVKELKVNGRVVSGNLVAIGDLSEGAQIEATLG